MLWRQARLSLCLEHSQCMLWTSHSARKAARTSQVRWAGWLEEQRGLPSGKLGGHLPQPALTCLPLANKPSITARRLLEGVEDLHAELKAYNDALLAGMTLDEREAAARQHRTTAAQLGLLPLDSLNDTASLLHRIAFLNGLYEEVRRGVQGERGGSCGSKPAGGLGWGACTSGRKRCCAFCAV